MVQFSINWTLTDMKVSSVKSNPMSELILSNEWKAVCFWQNSWEDLYPQSIEFRRVSTEDEVSISGTLSLQSVKYGGKIPVQKFSEKMQSKSSTIRIYLDNAKTNTIFLTSVVNITTVGSSLNEECRKCAHLKPLVEVSNDLGRLLEPENGYLADVVLKCGDASIPAHKIILSARSSVFAAMFKNPMKENIENKVVISDMEDSVLRIMLTFIYSGKLLDLTVSLASDLLIASDKYQIGDLKDICGVFLKDNLTPQNALKILFLGELHCSNVKSCAMDYISNACYQFSDLKETEDWKTVMKERPELAIDILTSIVEGKEKKQ